MKTIELRLEPDRETAVFQRLRYEWSEVSLREVLLMGIHPWGGPHAHRSLLEGFTGRLNRPELKPDDLESHGFCWDLHPSSSYYRYRRSTPQDPRSDRTPAMWTCWPLGRALQGLLPVVQ